MRLEQRMNKKKIFLVFSLTLLAGALISCAPVSQQELDSRRNAKHLNNKTEVVKKPKKADMPKAQQVATQPKPRPKSKQISKQQMATPQQVTAEALKPKQSLPKKMPSHIETPKTYPVKSGAQVTPQTTVTPSSRDQSGQAVAFPKQQAPKYPAPKDLSQPGQSSEPIHPSQQWHIDTQEIAVINLTGKKFGFLSTEKKVLKDDVINDRLRLTFNSSSDFTFDENQNRFSNRTIKVSGKLIVTKGNLNNEAVSSKKSLTLTLSLRCENSHTDDFLGAVKERLVVPNSKALKPNIQTLLDQSVLRLAEMLDQAS